MQKFRMLQGPENVKNSRESINENFISVASNFAGDIFPTSNLYVGMKFYHTGEQKTYTLRQLDPVRWDEDASGRLKNARNISLTGKVQSATVGFDGTADIAIQVTRVEADVCNGNAASATVAASVKGAISSQNAPRHVWFSGANSEAQREYANNFVYNPVTGTLAVPQVEGTASLASRAFTADRAGADGNGANIAATYVPKNGAGASGTWGINIGGRAAVANVADRVGNDAADMRFHWDGRGGQPPWVWGGDNPYDTRVYNPSNFNVNHANTANSAGSANTAVRADTAGRADSAARADTAKNADRAETARRAEEARLADEATSANGARRADTAGRADSAQRAKTSEFADNAQRAENANYATSAGYSANAGMIGGKTVEQITGGTGIKIALLSGSVVDKGRIPIPEGYTEHQCKFIVSPSVVGFDLWNGATKTVTTCYVGGRSVTCFSRVWYGVSDVRDFSGTAEYLVIGVK